MKTPLLTVALLLLASAAAAEPLPRLEDHLYCSRNMRNPQAYENCMRNMPLARWLEAQQRRAMQQAPQPSQQPFACFQIGRFMDCSPEY